MLRKHCTLIGLLAASVLPTACSNVVQGAGRSQGVPWWVWLLVIVVAFLVFLWLWLTSPKKERESPTAKPEAAPPAGEPEVAVPTAQVEVAAPSYVVETPEGLARHQAPMVKAPELDDLKRIEGIGPKIASLLQAAGITTFAHLASTDVRKLKRIIAEAGLTALADPTTWPEQATLAATGQWDELETLQDELKGGRRA
jgi:predicted flap endonuclease-1-like 5' DNA nuclease/predicted small secreted protein